MSKRAWTITELVFLSMLIGATVYYARSSRPAGFPLTEAMVCAATWLIVPGTWIMMSISRRLRGTDEPRGFDVAPPTRQSWPPPFPSTPPPLPGAGETPRDRS